VRDPAGTEYAGAGGDEAFRSLSRALGVPLDVAVRALADGSAAGMIEARGFACPGCGGTLRWAAERCYCGGRPGSRAAPPAPTLSGVEAEAQLRRRFASHLCP
jgi:hypothetical protein